VYLCIEVMYLCIQVIYLCIELMYLCMKLMYLCIELIYLCIEVTYLCIEVTYLCIEVMYLCIEIIYLCIEIMYLCIEVTYLFECIRLLHREVSFFSFLLSLYFRFFLVIFPIWIFLLRSFLSDVFTGISGRIVLSLISQWFPVPNSPTVHIFLTLTLVGWTDERLPGRARLYKEHLFSRPDFLLGKWSYS
jgi:hypothetical protein